MRILIYSQSFYPDHSGISIYASDFAFYCAKMGHEVDVITGFPFYPHWKKHKEDKGKLFRKDVVEGVAIHRGYIYVPESLSTAKRAVHEVSLFASALINSCRVKQPDITVVFATPVLLGVLGAFMKLFWRNRLVINVQDFQVEAGYSLGMVKWPGILKALERLEVWSYRRADYVSSISASMVSLLEQRKGLKKEKVFFWPNWKQDPGLDYEAFRKLFREKYGIPASTRIIGYAGNVGLKQGLEILVDVALAFRERNEVLFLIIGEGAGLSQVEEYAKAKGTGNVRFLPLLKPDMYKAFLADADAVFISQAKTRFDIYFPSKLLGIMDAGQLLLVSADRHSELYTTLARHDLALVAEYGDIETLVAYVNTVLKKDSNLDSLRARVRTYVKEFEREQVLYKALKTITEAP